MSLRTQVMYRIECDSCGNGCSCTYGEKDDAVDHFNNGCSDGWTWIKPDGKKYYCCNDCASGMVCNSCGKNTIENAPMETYYCDSCCEYFCAECYEDKAAVVDVVLTENCSNCR